MFFLIFLAYVRFFPYLCTQIYTTMKTIRIILLLFIVACFFSCNEIDPIDGQNTFTIDNKTNDTIKLVYSITPEVGAGLGGKTSTETISPQQKTKFLVLYIGAPQVSPNYVFEKLVFLSSDNDTLRILNEINDNEWIQTDSVRVGYLKPGRPFEVWFIDWTYTFSK